MGFGKGLMVPRVTEPALQPTLEALRDGSMVRLRVGAGISRNLAGRLWDVDPGNLARYESGQLNPSDATLRRLHRMWADLDLMNRRRRGMKVPGRRQEGRAA